MCCDEVKYVAIYSLNTNNHGMYTWIYMKCIFTMLTLELFKFFSFTDSF